MQIDQRKPSFRKTSCDISASERQRVPQTQGPWRGSDHLLATRVTCWSEVKRRKPTEYLSVHSLQADRRQSYVEMTAKEQVVSSRQWQVHEVLQASRQSSRANGYLVNL